MRPVERIKSTSDNLSGVTIAPGPPSSTIEDGPQIQTPFREGMTWEGVSIYNGNQHNVQGGERVTVEELIERATGGRENRDSLGF